MKKLTISELMEVHGGKNEKECKKLQALADAYIRDKTASAEDWEEWADDFEKNC
ncbi:MAG: hypothetical protein IKS65_02675 [Bacteroidales bacterium]|nr:hypothetical protein [Bacteroidales bacterium]